MDSFWLYMVDPNKERIIIIKKYKIQSLAYSFQRSDTSQLDFCISLTDGVRQDNVISITLRLI